MGQNCRLHPHGCPNFAKVEEQEVYRFGGENRFFPKQVEAYQNDFFPGLSFNDLGILEHLTFLAWHKRNVLLWASLPFMEKGIPRVASGTFKRSMKALRRNRCLFLWEHRRRAGNIWLINPILMEGKARERCKNLELVERVFNSDQKGLNYLSDHFDPLFGSKRSESRKCSGTQTDQYDPEEVDLRSCTDGAQRYLPATKLEGGGERSPINDEGADKGVLSDRITPPGNKGVGSLADKSSNPHVAQVIAYIDALPPIPTKNNILTKLGDKKAEYQEQFLALWETFDLTLISRQEYEARLTQLNAKYGVRDQLKRPKNKKPAVEDGVQV